MTDKREIPFGRPWLTEQDRHAVLQVLGGHVLTHGPECKAFEAEFSEFLGPGAHSVSVSSCMAALHLAYLHFGIGAGDEVIVPAMTHVATVHAVEWVGATPRFVDCDPRTGNVLLEAVEAAITPMTRAISIVHFVGIPVNMPELCRLAAKHKLLVIEDCALAVGSRWDGTHVGLFGDAGCFSFYPVKHMTTSEGGMFVTRHRDVAEKVARLRAFGVDRGHQERAVPGVYDVPSLGLNYRMGEMQAALGRTQLSRIAENLKGRKENFELLKHELRSIPLVSILDSIDPRGINSHYCLILQLEGDLAQHRAELISKLNQEGVGTSVYYPQPVPRMTYYKQKYGLDGARWPNATAVSDCSLALPVGWHVSQDDIRYIAAKVGGIVAEITKEEARA